MTRYCKRHTWAAQNTFAGHKLGTPGLTEQNICEYNVQAGLSRHVVQLKCTSQANAVFYGALFGVKGGYNLNFVE